MGYIHCCGALHKTRTYCLAPQGKFVLCEIDYLSKCPVCGHTVVQLTRIDKKDNISVIRRINEKAIIKQLKEKGIPTNAQLKHKSQKAKSSDNSDGKWVTINGNHVLIKD